MGKLVQLRKGLATTAILNISHLGFKWAPAGYPKLCQRGRNSYQPCSCSAAVEAMILRQFVEE